MTEDFDGAQSQPLSPLGWKAPYKAPPDEITSALLRKPTVSAEDLEAWRAYMRARPPEPTQKKPHTRVDGAWTTPQEWNRP